MAQAGASEQGRELTAAMADVVYAAAQTLEAASFAAVQAAMHQVGTDTVIGLGPNHAVTLQNVTATRLSAGNFVF